MVTLLNVGKSLRPVELLRFVPESDGVAPTSVNKLIKFVTSVVDLHEAVIAYDRQLLPS